MTEPAATVSRFQAEVAEAHEIASGVMRLRLLAPNGECLPPWTPGAHIDLVLPDGLVRQYSLCGDPADRSHYEIAVLLESQSRGGSRQLHAPGICGSVLELRGPRNHFALEPAAGYVFVAGGIGVTPLLPMARRAVADGVPWKFLYGGRSRASMAYLADLESLDSGDTGLLEVVAQDESGLPDLDRVLSAAGHDHLVYCCGPEGLLVAVEDRCATLAPGRLRLERFGAPSSAPALRPAAADGAISVELRRSGLVVEVPAERTILAAVEEVLPDVMFSCEEGYCGSCEVKVLAGDPDHRDTVLSEEERAQNATMMICVSRAKTSRLVLDL